jgi:4-hydroxy-4-methyl-2-oxoglutarate aldolase
MATSALAHGVAGLIITGGVRDSLALIALGLPTFSGRVCIRGTRKNPASDGAVGEPVIIGGVVIRRGDLVVGDADGVLVLPAESAEAAVAAARERDAQEVDILKRVSVGQSTLELYNL